MTQLTPKGRGLGRRPDKIDPRDRRYASVRAAPSVPIPARLDLSDRFPQCFDQLDTSSCGPNSASALMCFLYNTRNPYSRLQIYWGVRALEGDLHEDSGVETRDLFRVLQVTGAAPEALWPFNPMRMFVEPTQDVYDAAGKATIGPYARLNNRMEYLQCLAQGFPFILGFTVFESLDSDAVAKSGVLPMPTRGEKDFGGHDVVVVGYDTEFYSNSAFIDSGLPRSKVSPIALKIRNSWGPDWGLNGHFWMPIEYAESDVNGGDAWCAQLEPAEVTS